MITLWVLVLVYGHSAITVPGIASQQECERLYEALDQAKWVRWQPGGNHSCLPYQSIR